VEITQAKIEKLRQGAGTATEYFTLLDTYNNTAGYDETTLIRLLKQGILKPVLQSVYRQTALPITYADWKVAVIKHDGLRRAFHVMDGALAIAPSQCPRCNRTRTRGTSFTGMSNALQRIPWLPSSHLQLSLVGPLTQDPRLWT
jgi:hypothetical protein